MIDFYFITIHPQFIESYLRFGCFRSAAEQNILRFHAIDLREFAVDDRGSVDERPYGGGDGMVMRPEPLRDALASIPQKTKVVLLSPGGHLWSHERAVEFSRDIGPTTFICGRFGGIDQRFIERYVDIEISVGSFVVSGGELPALLVADSIVRQIPGVLGHEQSAHNDSFAEGLKGNLESPLYTKPQNFEGLVVPPVLLSGDHKQIAQWRDEQSRIRTKNFKDASAND